MVADKGHEIGLHGYSHENPIAMTLEQQTAIMDKVSYARLLINLVDELKVNVRVVLSFDQRIPEWQTSSWNRRSMVGVEPRRCRAHASVWAGI